LRYLVRFNQNLISSRQLVSNHRVIWIKINKGKDVNVSYADFKKSKGELPPLQGTYEPNSKTCTNKNLFVLAAVQAIQVPPLRKKDLPVCLENSFG